MKRIRIDSNVLVKSVKKKLNEEEDENNEEEEEEGSDFSPNKRAFILVGFLIAMMGEKARREVKKPLKNDEALQEAENDFLHRRKMMSNKFYPNF